MKNLEKINNIWDNLDKSFERLSNSGESKQDFLNRLIGLDSDGITALDYLEERLNEDLDTFTEKEHKQYLELLDKFRTIKDVYDGNKKFDITSLTTFINSLSDEKELQNLSLFTIEDIQAKFVNVIKEPIVLNLNDCYELTGCLGDSTVRMKGFFKSVVVDDPHALTFTNSQLYMRCSWIPKPENKVQPLAARYIVDLIDNGKKTDYNYLFIDQEYFDVTDTSVKLKIKGCNKYSKLSTVEEINNGYILDKKINGIKYRIVCFLQK